MLRDAASNFIYFLVHGINMVGQLCTDQSATDPNLTIMT